MQLLLLKGYPDLIGRRQAFCGYGAGRAEWSIVLDEPLTLTPALRCTSCKARTWLDGGKTRAAK